MDIDNRVTGKTRIIGVIGNPIEHSISPQLHNTISSRLGADLVYVPFKVEKEELGNAVKGLKALDLIGFNVTVPYKKDIIKYLDDNTKEALLMGAVNTVKKIEGRLYGYNTDAEGFSRSFREETGTGLKAKKILMLGAGGAARAIAVKAALEGAASIYIVNRTVSKASDIADIIANNFERKVDCFSYEDKQIGSIFSESDVIINTTSLGMYPEISNSPLNKHMKFSSHQLVYDIIYNPVKSKFLFQAEKAGCKAVNGLGMLFYQGIFAYEIWTGIKLTDKIVKELFMSFKSILRL